MKTDQPLKPCPFCGKPPSTSTYYIECDGCDIYFDWFHGKREDVIAKWNTRADKHGDKERVLEIIEEQERQWRLSNYEWSAACIRLRDLITAALSTSTPPSSTEKQGAVGIVNALRVMVAVFRPRSEPGPDMEAETAAHNNAELALREYASSTDGKTEGKAEWCVESAVNGTSWHRFSPTTEEDARVHAESFRVRGYATRIIRREIKEEVVNP